MNPSLKRIAVPACCGILLGLAWSPPPATSAGSAVYNYVNLEAITGQAGVTEAYDVNNAGRAVGMQRAWAPGAVGPRALLWNAPAGTAALLGTLGYDAVAASLNDADEVVGNSLITTGPGAVRHAFLWSAAAGMRDLNDLNGDGLRDYPDWEFVTATQINNSRQVAGTGYQAGSPTLTGYLLDLNTGTVTSLGSATSVLGMNEGTAPRVGIAEGAGYFLFDAGSRLPLSGLRPTGVNDRGEVAGEVQLSSGRRAYYWDGVSALPGRSLGVLSGGSLSHADALNNNATPLIVGNSTAKNLELRACRWVGPLAKPQDLNTITSGIPKNVRISYALSVSDTGYIAGYSGNFTTNAQDAYVLSPVR
jgi:probable HAF family extracellular repeat protein